MQFKLKLRCDNAAFDDDDYLGELARILRKVPEAVETGELIGYCYDINGNVAGKWELTL
jgi:hypothetical protein